MRAKSDTKENIITQSVSWEVDIYKKINEFKDKEHRNFSNAVNLLIRKQFENMQEVKS